MRYWLMKTEPSTFGVEDLAAAPRHTTGWDGVRNYQARNMLRDEMRRGDQAFLYYSSCEVPGVAAIMQIVKPGYPDPTAFDRKHHHYDPDSDREESALVHGGRAAQAPSGARHHARGAARARRPGAQGHGAAASGQSTLGDPGGSGALEVHSLARVMRGTRRAVHARVAASARA